MYGRNRESAANEAYKKARTILGVRNSTDIAPFIKSVRDEGLVASRTQSHAEDIWRWIGVDVSDRNGPIASMKIGSRVEGPGVSWGWSLECGEPSPNPPRFEPEDIGPNGPPPGYIARRFREYLNTCRRQVHPT
jgi:hypothetical protein